MEKLAIFFDHANISGAIQELGRDVDYAALRDYIAEDRFLVEAFIYYPINPKKQTEARKRIEALEEKGFFVRSKLGKPAGDDRYKCNVDVELAIDILRFVHAAKVDIVALVAGDGDMCALVREVRFNGVRCEVAFTAKAAAELRRAANGFIDLEQVIDQVSPR